MTNYICVTCGVQFASTKEPPGRCPICEDERQYVNPEGQSWTTLAELATTHRNIIQPIEFKVEGKVEIEAGLTGIATDPKFAIGQRALLIQGPEGNILWDCISFIDDATVKAINDLGGISAIAISHPHFYDSMVEWSHAFDQAPIYLPAADRQWIMRPDPAIIFWEDETYALNSEVTLIRCGGHFAGSTALHWSRGAEERGVLMTGDTIQVVADRRYVTFMYNLSSEIEN